MDKEQLIKFLKGKPRSLHEIATFFKIKDEKAKDELQVYLDNGLIIDSVNGYVLASNYGLVLAKIVLRKENFAYAEPVYNSSKDDIRISNKSLEGYILNDLVYLSFDNFNVASIAGLYKRDEYIVGNVFKAPEGGFLLHSKILENSKVKAVIVDDLSSKNISDGDLIKTKIVCCSVHEIDLAFIEVLVKANQVGADISSIIVSNDASLVFPKEVIEQAKSIPQSISAADFVDRTDFTSETIVTIDGEDALDFDDAISVKQIENGFEVGVYIADVANYVKPNLPIDEEASKRGTSIYVADRVVPMLPFELSNGICSLNPHVDRLVLACIMNVSLDGEVYSSKIVKGVINSKARLTYKQVNDYFETNKSDLDENILKMLDLAKIVCTKIRKRRQRYGAIDLETTEIKFHLDEKGNPIEILKLNQGEGEKLIEDLMIVTNCEIAKFLTFKNIPTLFRVHDNPPQDKLEAFKIFLKNIKMYSNFPSHVTSASLSHWYSSIDEPSLKKAISSFLLRSLAKAKYSPINDGHFGLAEEYYLHFTSPIRRYPDLLVHRELHEYVFDKKPFNYSSLLTYLTNMGISTSNSERKATNIEREVDDLEACKYMNNHLGEEYVGLITNITPKGIFLELENGLDAYLDILKINPYKKYMFSNSHLDIQSVRQNDVKDVMELYKLGDSIKVIVDKVTFEDKTIHVYTLAYKEYLENIEKYGYEIEKETEKEKERPDYSRFNKKRNSFSKKGEFKSRKSFGEKYFKEDRKNSKRSSKGRSNFKSGNKKMRYGKKGR